MRRFYERFLSVRKIPVPVVAAINGPAIGAGLCLALLCDYRVAAEAAPMGITFVGLGLHPGMGATHFLPRIAGPQVAARLILTGAVIKGDEAVRLGVVGESCPTPEETVDAAVALAEAMAAAGPLAVRTATRTLRLQMEEGLERSLWREADAQAQVWGSGDLAEGLDALVEKRRPSFANYESLAD
jgi:enoyl-CoA hydratase